MSNADRAEWLAKLIFAYLVGWGEIKWERGNASTYIRLDWEAFLRGAQVAMAENIFSLTDDRFTFQFTPEIGPDSFMLHPAVTGSSEGLMVIVERELKDILGVSGMQVPFVTDPQYILWAYLCGLIRGGLPEDTFKSIHYLGIKPFELHFKAALAIPGSGFMYVAYERERYVVGGSHPWVSEHLALLLNLK